MSEAGGKGFVPPSESRMQEGGRGAPSEASRMLEAALEQMDGIIQGAKYELPQFDNFNIQDSNYNPPMAATLPVRDALRNLKQSILSSPGNVLSHADTDTRDFLYNWLKNNKADYSKSLYLLRNGGTRRMRLGYTTLLE